MRDVAGIMISLFVLDGSTAVWIYTADSMEIFTKGVFCFFATFTGSRLKNDIRRALLSSLAYIHTYTQGQTRYYH